MIILPEPTNVIALKNMADDLESSFVIDKDNLMSVLSMVGMRNIEELLTLISNFFLEKFNMEKITISDIQNLNLKKLAYEFIVETGITKPKFFTPDDRVKAIDVFFKLGRLYIHDILFPELIESNPNLAYSTLNLLKRTVTSIAVSEKFDRRQALDMLMLDSINISSPRGLTENRLQDNHKNKFHVTRIEYIRLENANTRDIEAIAKLLYDDYNAIVKRAAFVDLINSFGEDIDVMEIRSSKIKLIVHLFYRMYTPYDKRHKQIIAMNKGKGLWEFLQQNIVDESGNTIPRLLRKISSEVNTDPGHERIIQDVKNILNPIYKKNNINKI